MTNPDPRNTNPARPEMTFFSVLFPTHEAATAAYRDATMLKLPGCQYAFPMEVQDVLTSVTFSHEAYLASSSSPPFATGEVVVLSDEAVNGLAQLAEVGLSRNFIEDRPVEVIGLDGLSTVGGELRGRKIGRNEPCPCGRAPRKKHKHCCGARGGSACI